jgi:ribosomal protein S17E
MKNKYIKMISKKEIEKYKKSSKLDFNLNFLINKEDKELLDKFAHQFDITTSGLLRILIKQFIKSQKSQIKENSFRS